MADMMMDNIKNDLLNKIIAYKEMSKYSGISDEGMEIVLLDILELAGIDFRR